MRVTCPERQLGGLVIEARKRNVMTQLRTLRGLIACACLSWASTSSADVVTDWNEVTAELIKTRSAASGPSGLFDLAMVHAAMHDAVQAR
jgi:hypothetical protein